MGNKSNKPIPQNMSPPTQHSSLWKPLKQITFEKPVSYFGSGSLPIINIGNNKLLITSRISNKDSFNGIYVYDTIRDEWVKWSKVPIATFGYPYSCAFITSSSILYICLGPHFCKLNIKSKKWKVAKNALKQFGYGTECININDEIHVIGGSRNNTHYKWNDNDCKFVIESIPSGPFDMKINNHKLIFVESKQKLFLIGGERGTGYSDKIHFYDLQTKGWHEHRCIPKIMFKFGVALTNDDKYIIIVDGNNGQFYILDIDNTRYYTTKIKTPIQEGELEIICVLNTYFTSLLVNGYIRTIEFETFVSADIIDLIIKMYMTEYIHVINGQSQHWKLPIHEILDTLIGDFSFVTEHNTRIRKPFFAK
eukprot:373647_1